VRTGRLNDALASSHFAIAGKLTGHDAIVVRGACDVPSVLLDPVAFSSVTGGNRPYGGSFLQDTPCAGVMLNMMDPPRHTRYRLLGSPGFTPRHLRTLVTAESLLLVGTGVAIGTVAALIAIAPALAERGQGAPLGGLLVLIGAVVVTGLLSSFGAVRLATSVPVVQALKHE